MLLGYGPDHFVFHFPQEDIANKFNYLPDNQIVDKPHNMYLQTAVNTGMISLLALLVFFGIYFFSSLKLLFKRDTYQFLDYAALGIFAGFCGYCVTGIINDQVVSVGALFWILLGVGIGTNRMIVKGFYSL